MVSVNMGLLGIERISTHQSAAVPSASYEYIRKDMSMKPRILFVSTYSELTAIAECLSAELSIPIDIIEGGISIDGHLNACKMSGNYDVIVSQGATALSIESMVSIPVVSIVITIGDFLRAFEKARSFGNPLNIICYRGELETELRQVAAAFSDLSYAIHTYSNKEEFAIQTSKVFSLNSITIMAFGGCVKEHAMKAGHQFILVESNPENIRKALMKAKNIVDFNKREKIEARRLKNLIDYSSEGIISYDKHMRIKVFNASAERILRISAQQVIDKEIHDPETPLVIKKLSGDGSFAEHQLLQLNQNALVFNRLPLDIDNQLGESIITVQEMSYIQKVETSARMQSHKKGLVARHTFDSITGRSAQILETVAKAQRYSASTVSVLIQGETGTGKELFAHSIHNAGSRADAPFVAVNCAALSESLLESELFGYDAGAFTGAKKEGRMGLFELAHNGTIFLDEIGEISASLQSSLLRVLQEKAIRRVGGDRMINVNVRIIAATNRNLYQMVAAGQFRRDLYFRLNLLNLSIPPLRVRADDIRYLADHFIRIKSLAHGVNIPLLSEDNVRLLKAYSWPGNVRELEFFLEKLVVLYDEGIDFDQFIADAIHEHSAMHRDDSLDNTALDSSMASVDDDTVTVKISQMKDMQSQIISTLLDRANGNKVLLAKKLGLSRTTVWKNLSDKKTSKI